MQSIFIQAAQLIFSLTILVVAHEFGHFFFSKIFKVRVEKFYLFFNPSFSIFKARKINGHWKFRFFSRNEKPTDTPIDQLSIDDWRRYPQNTEWGIGWLPLGGYCKIAGMVDESMDNNQITQPAKPWEYRAASPWKRLPIITGGVFVNFLMALVLYSAILFTWGEEYIPIQNYKNGFEFSNTAKRFGFRDGDILLQADSVPLEHYNDIELRKILDAKNILVSRNGKPFSIQLNDSFSTAIVFSKEPFATPRFPFVAEEVMNNSPAQKAGFLHGDSLISINNQTQYTFFSFAKIIGKNKGKSIQIGIIRNGENKTISVTPDTSGVIGIRPKSPLQLFESKKISYSLFSSIPAGIKLGINRLTGYVSDFKYIFSANGMESLGGFASMGKMYDVEWNWPHLWNMTAFLSIILAFMNILPIPALDGGHLLFLIYEMITKRKPNQNFMIKAQLIGMVFLFSLMIFANLNDFLR